MQRGDAVGLVEGWPGSGCRRGRRRRSGCRSASYSRSQVAPVGSEIAGQAAELVVGEAPRRVAGLGDLGVVAEDVVAVAGDAAERVDGALRPRRARRSGSPGARRPGRWWRSGGRRASTRSARRRRRARGARPGGRARRGRRSCGAPAARSAAITTPAGVAFQARDVAVGVGRGDEVAVCVEAEPQRARRRGRRSRARARRRTVMRVTPPSASTSSTGLRSSPS